MKTCIFTIIKNEQEYLDLWLRYHLFEVGIDHIFIYEDVGSLSHSAITEKYGDRVSLLPVESLYEGSEAEKHYLQHLIKKNASKQQSSLRNIVKRAEEFKEYKWGFFIDIDEFVTIEPKRTLEEVLNLYDEYEGIYLCWQNYNANGYIYKPAYEDGDFTKVYTQKCGFTKADEKMLVCTKMALKLDKVTPSKFVSHHRVFNMKTTKTNFVNDKKEITYDNIYLRHYITKSWEEYIWKFLVRGMFHKYHRKYEDFFQMNPDLADRKEELLEMVPSIIEKYGGTTERIPPIHPSK